MSNIIDIDFLGKKYNLPYDIITYTNEHEQFESMRQELLSFVLENFSDFQNLPKGFEDLINGKYREYANICIKKLFEHDIYDITVDDYLENNKGAAFFHESLKNSMLERSQALIERISGVLEGTKSAAYERDSQITGSGLTIYTNSLIDFGAWAIMEAKELSDQESRADALYRARVNNLIDKCEANMTDRLIHYNKNVWLPNIKSSTDSFIIELFNKYVDDLITHGKFSRSALDYHKHNRAQEIVNSIEHAKDKNHLLQSAFECCPYCLSIYIAAIENDNDIESVITTAQKLNVMDKILDYYISKIKNLADDSSIPEATVKSIISPYINILSKITQRPHAEIMKSALSNRRKKIVKALGDIAKIQPNTNELETLISKTIFDSVESVVQSYRSNTLKDSIHHYIMSNILNNDNADYYKTIVVKVIDDLYSKALVYATKVNQKYERFILIKSENERIISTLENRIIQCQNEINSLGVFAFRRKKELEQQITDMLCKINKCNGKISQASYWHK